MKTRKELHEKIERLKHKNKNAETHIEGLKGKIKILKETNKRYLDKLPDYTRSCK